MKQVLNENEQKVLDACKMNAKEYNEDNCFCFDEVNLYEAGDISFTQFKGYLSQLQQKGYIIKLEDSYFSHKIINNGNN